MIKVSCWSIVECSEYNQREKKSPTIVRIKNFHNADIVPAVDPVLARYLRELSAAMWVIISCGWPNR